jgi:hypothetical protein
MGRDPEIAVRSPREADLPWIYSTFIRSLANQKTYRSIEPHLLSAMLHALCTRILSHCACVVACDPDDEDQVYGYAIGDQRDRLLAWAYTKHDFRGFHVGSRLVEAMLGDLGGEPVGLLLATGASRHLETKWRLVPRPEAVGRMR